MIFVAFALAVTLFSAQGIQAEKSPFPFISTLDGVIKIGGLTFQFYPKSSYPELMKLYLTSFAKPPSVERQIYFAAGLTDSNARGSSSHVMMITKTGVVWCLHEQTDEIKLVPRGTTGTRKPDTRKTVGFVCPKGKGMPGLSSVMEFVVRLFHHLHAIFHKFAETTVKPRPAVKKLDK